MEKLRVRFYNVLFGDAIFITVPDYDDQTGETTTRNILIDVGNVLGGPGGNNDVFKPIIEDVINELGGKSLDLYIMTHEHLDHVQGLFHYSTNHNLELEVDYAWLTASAAPDYYDKHPNAKKQLEAYRQMFSSIEKFLKVSALDVKNSKIKAILANNNPQSTGQCVNFLRTLAKEEENTSYVYRGCQPKHPFKEVKFDFWAPEEDTSIYYGRFHPLSLSMTEPSRSDSNGKLTELEPPAGVDAGTFYDLVESRRGGIFDNLLAIDKASNNTSVVFCMEWRGWRLLLCGDAEQRSWKTIMKELPEDNLQPIHLLKVSHHGSSNGMPVEGILDKILPVQPPDERTRIAAVSTCLDAYNEVPHTDTLTLIQQRCNEIKSTLDIPENELFFDTEFPP